MANLGFSEILLILVLCLLLFGAKRLPEIGASMGKGIREFKRSLSDAGDALNAPPDDSRTASTRQIDAPTSSGGDPKRLSQ